MAKISKEAALQARVHSGLASDAAVVAALKAEIDLLRAAADPWSGDGIRPTEAGALADRLAVIVAGLSGPNA